jgi:hypothetical protein
MTNESSVEELCRRGLALLAAGDAAAATREFRAAIAAGDGACGGMTPALAEAHLGLVRALRAAGWLEQSIGAALALTALAPGDAVAHRELAESLRQAGHATQAEAAAARARVLEWKAELAE